MGIQSWNIEAGEGQNAVPSHASTHKAGQPDAIAPADIGARALGIKIDWGELDGIPDFGAIYRAISASITWEEIQGKSAFATRWPNFNEIGDNPFSVPITYGSVSLTGSLNGYSGFRFADSQGPSFFMVRNSDGLSGVWRADSQTWRWYFDGSGVLTSGTVPFARTSGVASATEAAQSYSYSSGWSPYSATLFIPSYRRMDKLIVLSGLVQRTTTSGTIIATLPSGYRPPSRRSFSGQGISSGNFINFMVDVDINGQILLVNPLPTTAIAYISLDNISFFVA